MEGNDAPQDAEEDAEQVYQQDEQEGNLVIDLGDGLENMTADLYDEVTDPKDIFQLEKQLDELEQDEEEGTPIEEIEESDDEDEPEAPTEDLDDY